MARKRQKRRKTTKSPSLLLTLFLVLISLIVYEQYRLPLLDTVDQVGKRITGTAEAEPVRLTGLEGIEIPRNITSRQERLISYTGFTVSYNQEWKIPNWVAYELTGEKVKGEEKRTDKFLPDPRLELPQANTKDYTNSGYDRGHMAPAGDMKWHRKAMEESFYFTNICPQNRRLNSGRWHDVEKKIRDWALQDSAIVVVCGPIVERTDRTIGENRVVVPDAFYKVVLSPYASPPTAIGFIMKNENVGGRVSDYIVSIDSIQRVTGLDFFYRLPDELEKKLESGQSLPFLFTN